MPPLIACSSCRELVKLGSCTCPHCGAAGVCRTAGLPAAALLMGLVLGDGCIFAAQPEYGVADTSFVDGDADGWGRQDGDCDDDDATIHPNAEETAGDGVDSNCNDDDDS